MGDKNIENARTIAKIMNDAGFDVEPVEMDLSSRESIMNLIAEAKNMEKYPCWSMRRGFYPARLLLKPF